MANTGKVHTVKDPNDSNKVVSVGYAPFAVVHIDIVKKVTFSQVN